MCRCSTAVNARYGRGSLPRWACTKYVRSGQESTSALQSGCRLIPSSVTSGGAVASAAASSVGVTPTCAPSASILRGAKFARRRSSTATPPVLLACAGQCNPKLLSAHERQKPPNWCPFTGRVRFRSRSELPGVPASQGHPRITTCGKLRTTRDFLYEHCSLLAEAANTLLEDLLHATSSVGSAEQETLTLVVPGVPSPTVPGRTESEQKQATLTDLNN